MVHLRNCMGVGFRCNDFSNDNIIICPLCFTIFVDLMEGLREIPGREALKLRAEASPKSSSFIHV